MIWPRRRRRATRAERALLELRATCAEMNADATTDAVDVLQRVLTPDEDGVCRTLVMNRVREGDIEVLERAALYEEALRPWLNGVAGLIREAAAP